MIENMKIRNRKDLVEFITTSICDGDFRAKIQDIPDVLDRNTFDVDKFLSTLESVEPNKCPSAEVQNNAMLFIELVLKGNLSVSKAQLDKLSSLMK